MELKPGARFRSTASDAEAVVVKAPAGDVDLRCGGHPMVPVDADVPPRVDPVAGFDGELLIGKRYTDASGELELLCTKAGASSLSLGDEPLGVKDAKPLPSSD